MLHTKSKIHPLYHCNKFEDMKLTYTVNIAKKHKLCYNFHKLAQWHSKRTCFVCKSSFHHTLFYHHTLKPYKIQTICRENKIWWTRILLEMKCFRAKMPNYFFHLKYGNNKIVLIKTAKMCIRDSNGARPLKLIVDSASESYFPTISGADALCLKK